MISYQSAEFFSSGHKLGFAPKLAFESSSTKGWISKWIQPSISDDPPMIFVTFPVRQKVDKITFALRQGSDAKKILEEAPSEFEVWATNEPIPEESVTWQKLAHVEGKCNWESVNSVCGTEIVEEKRDWYRRYGISVVDDSNENKSRGRVGMSRIKMYARESFDCLAK